jgi:ferritin-like metal-binding protein YciE
MKNEQFEELVLQSLEHELGGVKVYEAAVQCALEPELKQEWERYLGETRGHVAALEGVCKALQLDPRRETPGRAVVRHLGAGLVQAMKMALSAGKPEAAQLVACECVVVAETKDHLDWELLAKCAEELSPPQATALREAVEQIEDQEDEHLYHTKGWCRELWIQSLGMNAVLPPLEEQKRVKTAIGAARAEQAAEQLR